MVQRISREEGGTEVVQRWCRGEGVKKCRCKYAEVQQWVADAELVLSECGCRGGAEMKVQR